MAVRIVSHAFEIVSPRRTSDEGANLKPSLMDVSIL